MQVKQESLPWMPAQMVELQADLQAPEQTQSKSVLKKSRAEPQRSAEEAWPCAASAQEGPEHTPHLPPSQVPLQQSPALVQDTPSCLQVEQVPLVQVEPSQQSLGPPQAVPTLAQHAPSTLHWRPLQHLPPGPQASPAPLQCAQVPWLQTLEQQSLARAQAVLSSWQLPHLLL